MSIIFEALKKAQAQAEKGQIPTLQTQHGLASPKEQRTMRTPILLAAFVCAGIGAWWSMRPSSDVDAATNAAQTTQSATDAIAEQGSVLPAGAPQQIRVGSGSAKDSGQESGQQSGQSTSDILPPEMGGSHGNTPNSQNFSVPQLSSPMTGIAQAEQATTPITELTQAPEATPEVTAQFTPDSPVQQLDVSNVPNDAQRYPQMMTPYTGTASVPAEMPIQAPAQALPVVAALPKIYDLDYQVRHSLPKISVSMHVYNNNPSRRFVVVNGKRLREGDNVENLQISEIRADGMEVEFQGQRFLYPRM